MLEQTYAAGVAIVKVRYSQIELRAQKGNRLAGIAQGMLNHLDAYLSATQLGITLASLGLGWISEPVVSKLLIAGFHGVGLNLAEDLAHQIALPVAFAIITVLHMVFGELAPKSIAIRKPEYSTRASRSLKRISITRWGSCTPKTFLRPIR